MFRIAAYDDRYEEGYCALYITTWRAAPYCEVFTKQEITDHLPKNRNYLFLLIRERDDAVVGFVGGRPLSRDCGFYKNALRSIKNKRKAFYIDELGVHDSCRGRGWGRLLTEFLIASAGPQYEQFLLRTHAGRGNRAIDMYYALGFRPRFMPQEAGKPIEVECGEVEQRRISGRLEKDYRIYMYLDRAPKPHK